MIKKSLKNLKRQAQSVFQSTQEKRHSLVGPAHLWKMKQEFQYDFLIEKGLKPNHKFLDVGCGTLRGGIPLIDYLDSGNYYGIEVREPVLEEGRKELAASGLAGKNPTLKTFDTFDTLKLDAQFDMMFAFSVLIHMADPISAGCIAFAGKHLAPDGIFYANVNFGERSDGEWQGFPVVYRTLDFYQSMANANGLTVKPIGTLLELGHDSGQPVADKQIMLEITRS